MKSTVLLGVALAMASPLAAQDTSGIEQAVDALAQTYMDGWSQGDAAACASIYAEDADLMDFMGASVKGRAAIQESIAQTLQTFGSSTIKIERTSIHAIGSDVAVSDGTWEVMGSSAQGAPTQGFYTVILMMKDGAWKIVSGRSKVPPPMPAN